MISDFSISPWGFMAVSWNLAASLTLRSLISDFKLEFSKRLVPTSTSTLEILSSDSGHITLKYRSVLEKRVFISMVDYHQRITNSKINPYQYRRVHKNRDKTASFRQNHNPYNPK